MNIPSVVGKVCYGHSIGSYDLQNDSMFSVLRGPNELPHNRIDDTGHFYQIVYLHFEPCDRNIQPASMFNNDYSLSDSILWMNGELASKEIEKLQFEEDTKETWEPWLMLHHVERYGSPVEVDGSFACMYSDGTYLYAFRNQLEAIFFDKDFNFCSLPFENSEVLPSEKMFQLDMEKKKMKVVDTFTTIRHWT